MDVKKISLGILAILVIGVFFTLSSSDLVKATSFNKFSTFSSSITNDENLSENTVLHRAIFVIKASDASGGVFGLKGRVQYTLINSDGGEKNYSIVGGCIILKAIGENDSAVKYVVNEGEFTLDSNGFFKGYFTAQSDSGDVISLEFNGVLFNKPQKMHDSSHQTQKTNQASENSDKFVENLHYKGMYLHCIKHIRKLGSFSAFIKVGSTDLSGNGLVVPTH